MHSALVTAIASDTSGRHEFSGRQLVHLVPFSLDDGNDHEKLLNLLDDEGRSRSLLFAAECGRRRFEAAHGLTGVVLGRYLRVL
jgi:hypothetical protein